MDLLIGCYKTFTIRWRIRVNPGKCKVMYSEKTLAADTRTHLFGDTVIAEVHSLWFVIRGSGGHIFSFALQSKEDHL